MAITSAFHEAVASGNIRRVRIMMKDSLLVDPTFKEFNEMDRAASPLRDLYDVHDNRPFENDENQWTDEYMDKMMVQVVSNFSHERIDHLKAVVRKLRPVSETHSTTTSRPCSPPSHEETGTAGHKQTSYQEQKKKDQESGKYLGAKVATGAVAGAVVGGAIAGVASASVIAGAIAGAAVGAVAVSAVEMGGKNR